MSTGAKCNETALSCVQRLGGGEALPVPFDARSLAARLMLEREAIPIERLLVLAAEAAYARGVMDGARAAACVAAVRDDSSGVFPLPRAL